MRLYTKFNNSDQIDYTLSTHTLSYAWRIPVILQYPGLKIYDGRFRSGKGE